MNLPELPVLDPLLATLIAAAVCAFAVLAAVLAAHRGNADPKWDRVTVRGQMRQARRERTRMTPIVPGAIRPGESIDAFVKRIHDHGDGA